ncbi:methylated-DNA--[protein]-cysteine S-methyltransferase [Zeaxanthinibacter sp. PT1]|uniref:methylated-DNA--[protein]-cysteine S-methyltransferase n=1 Tax=Zeaxanthinibacter TaxID=561554 RepID=UPI00234B8250|nr:methylated-DNA--[protein]-cysteine S-methyltransferase [Zeaxanthinibacter sp. PT1]MDC6351995.1 methylated-DNA--[protein]-cysteine S-methyltransferase [Zeaxanthinibacter sp. PT1]
MEKQEVLDYQRIEKAIDYIRKHFREQPTLDEIAEQVHLSPAHFQRLFTNWAGVSPKKFIQFLSLEYAKKLLGEQKLSLFDTAEKTGLSGTGRLHDLFLNIEGMTPGEYRKGAMNLEIHYEFYDSVFGKALIASTGKGICQVLFTDDEEGALEKLRGSFPKAKLEKIAEPTHLEALRRFQADPNSDEPLTLHLKGTPFQLKVWQALLQIPEGKVKTYGQIAAEIEMPKASRAVGTAIGSNPVGFLIPCHRVIQSSGALGGYRWGVNRKSAILGWEASRLSE